MALNISTEKYWKSMKIWIDKPHLINKKICGSDIKWIGVSLDSVNLNEVVEKCQQNVSEENCSECSKIDSLVKILMNFGYKNEKFEITSNEIAWYELFNSDKCSYIAIVRKNIVKNIDLKNLFYEVIIIDTCSNITLFIPEESSQLSQVIPQFSYSLILKGGFIHLDFEKNGKNESTSGYKWLETQVLPTLTKWAANDQELRNNGARSSLQLVNIQHYNEVYQNLKKKYKKYLLEIWTETTDPLKYISEDLAIAAYLLLIWDNERKNRSLRRKQSFLDLGCGNGLLVYILSSEGHPGKGIDIRKRKLWDKFPDYVHLQEEVITPSDQHLYPTYDWLIGNHSDELTPWLPVICAKSSFQSRFFLLPCCTYDFQTKFQRKNSGISQYGDYLNYVEEIGVTCGFDVEKDRLRIPSTKRSCFIGQNRSYNSEQWNEAIEKIDEFIKGRCAPQLDVDQVQKTGDELQKVDDSHKHWCSDFKPRETVQPTRNCTQISTEIRDKIVTDIGRLLVSESHMIEICYGGVIREWNKGKSIPLKVIVSQLNGEDLKHLKKECGGLQTLLRNHKYIFKIENGNVSLRLPKPSSLRTVSKDLLKRKDCWFHFHHPQGCALTPNDCSYKH